MEIYVICGYKLSVIPLEKWSSLPPKSSYKNPQMTQIDADKNKKEPENLARIVGEIGFYLWKSM